MQVECGHGAFQKKEDYIIQVAQMKKNYNSFFVLADAWIMRWVR